MTCKELELFAIDYVEGALPKNRRAAVDLHLGSCASCAERLKGFARVNLLLDEWQAVAPSPSFETRLEQRIAGYNKSAGWWQRFSEGFLSFPSANPALAGAVFAMIIVAVVLVGYEPTGSSPAVETQAVAQEYLGTPTDELALYRDLPVLENWDLLRNFEVLQELNEATP